MAITNVKKLSELASTALASYAYFTLRGYPDGLILPDASQGVGMTTASVGRTRLQCAVFNKSP